MLNRRRRCGETLLYRRGPKSASATSLGHSVDPVIDVLLPHSLLACLPPCSRSIIETRACIIGFKLLIHHLFSTCPASSGFSLSSRSHRLKKTHECRLAMIPVRCQRSIRIRSDREQKSRLARLSELFSFYFYTTPDVRSLYDLFNKVENDIWYYSLKYIRNYQAKILLLVWGRNINW